MKVVAIVRLLLERITNRLIEGGLCPYDPFCLYDGEECRAGKEDLLEKEEVMRQALTIEA